MAEVFEVGKCCFVLVLNEGYVVPGAGNTDVCLNDAKWHQPPWNLNFGKSSSQEY